MYAIQETTPAQLSEWLDSAVEDLLLIDVRTPEETAQAMLPGAEAVPMHLVPLQAQDWREQKKIVVYCRTGARSAQVCAFLQQQGITQAYNLRGGIVDWHRQGYPLAQGTPAARVG